MKTTPPDFSFPTGFKGTFVLNLADLRSKLFT